MIRKTLRTFLVSDYGSLSILFLLCVYFSLATLKPYHPVSPTAGRRLAGAIVDQASGGRPRVLIATRAIAAELEFAEAIRAELAARGAEVVGVSTGGPAEVRLDVQRAAAEGPAIDAIATSNAFSNSVDSILSSLRSAEESYPGLARTEVWKPRSYTWPMFLNRSNIQNILNQNAEIAIIAIGMTMVIITAGIDLSVGSLLALSAVVSAFAAQRWFGGADASFAAVLLCGALGVGLTALCGAFSGVMVTALRIPAFIVTLGMMMVARGVAYRVCMHYQKVTTGEGTPQLISVDADSIGRLAEGDVLGVPNSILLMFLLFVVAHVVMSHTTLGRYIYAVGGNEEAARLSGVPVRRTVIVVYMLCGALAGLVGLLNASRFHGGDPKAGELYELYVIAAVVVGGTSIAGGEGRVLGTLIGSLILAVIRNGLNMTGVTTFTQLIVFGSLILAAVLLDKLKGRHLRPASGGT